jgi:signal transduction histidine kinase
MVGEQARKGAVALRAEQVPADFMLHADELRLKQVLLNLLTNAVKFTPAGGEVRLAAGRAEDGGVELRVTDTGCGIPPDRLEDLMQPFAQGELRPTRTAEGTGLGLPLTRVLVERHGGRLTLESAPGRGTTARVWLPAERITAEPAAPAAAYTGG